MKVAVLAGGRSSEHEVSLASGRAIVAGLAEAGHEAVLVEIARDGRWTSGGQAVTVEPAAGLLGADVAFPALHGPYGEDGTVQGLLEVLDLPYVGAGVRASAISMDKVVFKELAARAGVPQVDFVALRESDDAGAVARLGLPVFVKPARLGSSVGISKVSTGAELPDALRAAFEHDPLVIVEAFAGGLEVECSVLGNGQPDASEPGQVVLAGADWYDYEAKYEPGGMELHVPAPLPEAVRRRIQQLAIEVFRLVECAGMARVDFFVDPERGEDGVLVNELNTIPGFTSTSVYAKLFAASGVPYPELLDRLLHLALERHTTARAYTY